MTIAEILRQSLIGKRIVPTAYPTLEGVVTNVIDIGDEGITIGLVFADQTQGVDGIYRIHDIEEPFTVWDC